MQAPVLHMPNFGKQFILQTDASSVALAAVLSQEVHGSRQPITYVSRILSSSERKPPFMNMLLVIIGYREVTTFFLEHSVFLLEN